MLRNLLCTDLYRRILVGFIVDEAHCVKEWGDSFRQEYSNLGEIRSIIPEDVHVIALTATATKSTRQAVIQRLGMHKPVVVNMPPVRNNIIYSVAKKTTDIYHWFLPLCDKLRAEGVRMGRVIIFCKTYGEVTGLYYLFKHRLKEYFTYPIASPDFIANRLVDMYTGCTHQSVKTRIVERFTSESPLRVIIGTIAFGMGIDSPDVRQVIHWGVSKDIEMYVQESGRAGRDGHTSFCLMLYDGGDLDKRRVRENIIKYCKNKDNFCRRPMLFSDFEGYDGSSGHGCRCCDVCKSICKCGSCDSNLKNFYLPPTTPS